ncbi:unnamed protein product [Rhizophagus irregularis]|nr:unnamed protein product [Rhizophagus irregularis]CAB5394271.1 unnamed protein product [Rhizophagus irregularis]
MTILVSDAKLFAIVLYSTFVNNEHLPSVRDIWKNSWVTGASGALVIGLVGAIVVPLILSAIICGLGFGVEGVVAGSFGSWFMSLYGGMIARGSLVSILQSIGAAGLGTLGTSISSSFGAAIGILIGAIGGSNLATYFKEMDLNDSENKIFGSLVQIEQNTYQNNHHMIVFTLMPALLYNETVLRCFFETFIASSSFVESKLFRFNFKENNLSKLKSEQEKVNHTAYNLLIGNDKEFKVKSIFHNDLLIGYNLNLNNYQSSNDKVKLLADIWKLINGNIVLDIDIDKIRDQFHDQIQSLLNYFHGGFKL